MSTQPGWRLRSSALLALAPTTESVMLPESVPDPCEPFNRMMWSFDKGVMLAVIKPTSKVYWFIVLVVVLVLVLDFPRGCEDEDENAEEFKTRVSGQALDSRVTPHGSTPVRDVG